MKAAALPVTYPFESLCLDEVTHNDLTFAQDYACRGDLRETLYHLGRLGGGFARLTDLLNAEIEKARTEARNENQS